jgi:peptide/nickel transport system permease protein
VNDPANIREDSVQETQQKVDALQDDKNGKKGGESFLTATQGQLIWRAFKKHRLAHGSMIVLLLVYLVAVFAEFLSPYSPMVRFTEHLYAPPQRIHFWDGERFSLRPFVYGREQQLDLETLKRSYAEVKDQKYYVKLFHRGEPYKMWGLFEMRMHLFGVDRPGTIFLFGADELGRDMLSRIIFASRISLSIGLIGVALAFILGCTLGAASGYFGGVVDNAIQRTIEFLRSIPTIPLWMGLSAALPPDWSLIQRYFGITIILSLVAWTGLARVVRGKFLELRQAEFVTAARLAGTSDFRIILTHMFPGFISYLIVNSTLQIPRMILAETSLSFLGLGLRPPVISWGVLLQKAQNIRTVAVHPWLMLPVLAVILTVLLFNFVGDGLRDAADPYKSM